MIQVTYSSLPPTPRQWRTPATTTTAKSVPATIGSQVEALLPHYGKALESIGIDAESSRGRYLTGLAVGRLCMAFEQYGHRMFLQNDSELRREENEELADYLNRRAERERLDQGGDVE